MKPNTQHKNTKGFSAEAFDQKQISYPEAIAGSLVLYAQRNEKFAAELKNLIPNICGQINGGGGEAEVRTFPPAIETLVPATFYHAVERARWLQNTLLLNSLQDTSGAVSLLETWARRHPQENPKQLVVGVVVVAVPGITMGKFKIKKDISVITRKDVLKKSNIELATKIVRANNDILAKAIDTAKGNLRMLEPDVADWLWEGQKITMYETTNPELEKIVHELQEISIPFSAIRDETGIAVIAISPSANISGHKIHWNIKEIEQE